MPIARVDNLSDRFPACPRAPFARTLPDLELDIGIGDSEHLAAPIRLRGEGSRSLGSVGFIGRAPWSPPKQRARAAFPDPGRKFP